jgi:hypothetical protein
MEPTKSLTYEELAEALGLLPESARRLVRRKRWMRRPGNDRRVRIEVPLEALADAAPHTPADARPDGAPDARPDITSIIGAFNQHIARVEKELEAVKAERDSERAISATLALTLAEAESLKAVLVSQKALAEAERDRWHAEASRRLFGRRAA